jgi:prepilin-type N-terminal cleavage/methylation domain-containing protein
MISRKNLNDSGFTLIEIIITVVIVAILGAMILTFLSASLIKSSDPIIAFQRASDLNKVIANITADYNKYPKWRSGTTYAVGNFVVPTIRNGKYYICTQGGTSNNNEPNWSLLPINDGSVKWAESGMLPDLITLRGNIGPENSDQNNAYGSYHVEKNRFVSFNSSDSEVDDTSGLNKILKVTIKSNQGGTLAALFISN